MEDFNKMRTKLKTILRELDKIKTGQDDNENKVNLKLMEYGLNMAKFEQFAMEIKRKMIEHEIQLYELKQQNEKHDKLKSLTELIDHYKELNCKAVIALEFKRYFKLQECSCQK